MVLAGAIPNRAEAGIAIVSADTAIAAAINKIRLMVGSSGPRSCGLLPQFPCLQFVPLQFPFRATDVFSRVSFGGRRAYCLFLPA